VADRTFLIQARNHNLRAFKRVFAHEAALNGYVFGKCRLADNLYAVRHIALYDSAQHAFGGFPIPEQAKLGTVYLYHETLGSKRHIVTYYRDNIGAMQYVRRRRRARGLESDFLIQHYVCAYSHANGGLYLRGQVFGRSVPLGYKSYRFAAHEDFQRVVPGSHPQSERRYAHNEQAYGNDGNARYSRARDDNGRKSESW